MYEQVAKEGSRGEEDALRKRVHDMTKELGADYEEMLRKDFEGNKVKIVREYLARKYGHKFL